MTKTNEQKTNMTGSYQCLAVIQTLSNKEYFFFKNEMNK